MPVTSKAQESEEYKDYLSRCGEDDSTYYEVKIKASKLLLDNTENTFVTPVFNGSASLRDAAGQLIENVTKSVRRKQEVNDEYIDNLYHLDQGGGTEVSGSGKREDLGELPATAVILLASLAGAWILIILYLIYGAVKKKRCQKERNNL